MTQANTRCYAIMQNKEMRSTTLSNLRNRGRNELSNELQNVAYYWVEMKEWKLRLIENIFNTSIGESTLMDMELKFGKSSSLVMLTDGIYVLGIGPYPLEFNDKSEYHKNSTRILITKDIVISCGSYMFDREISELVKQDLKEYNIGSFQIPTIIGSLLLTKSLFRILKCQNVLSDAKLRKKSAVVFQDLSISEEKNNAVLPHDRDVEKNISNKDDNKQNDFSWNKWLSFFKVNGSNDIEEENYNKLIRYSMDYQKASSEFQNSFLSFYVGLEELYGINNERFENKHSAIGEVCQASNVLIQTYEEFINQNGMWLESDLVYYSLNNALTIAKDGLVAFLTSDVTPIKRDILIFFFVFSLFLHVVIYKLRKSKK